MSKKEIALTEEQLQKILDEQTTFSLASLMLSLTTGMALKNKPLIVNTFMKSQVVLQNNPGFVERFRRAQKAIIETMEKESPPTVTSLIENRRAGPPEQMPEDPM